MTFNPDDPKWTAYVLGELEASDRVEVESLLESSEEARAYLEELRAAAGALHEELRMESTRQIIGGLSPEQRAALRTAAEMESTGPVNRVRWFNRLQAHPGNQTWIAGLAVAAMILIAVAIPSLWRSKQTNGTGTEPVLSTDGSRRSESIAPSPAITTDQVSKAEGMTAPAVSKNNSKASESKAEMASQSLAQEKTPAILPSTSAAEAAAAAPPAVAGPAATPPVATANIAQDQNVAGGAAVNNPEGLNGLRFAPQPVVPSAAPGGGGGRGGGGGGRGGGRGGAAFSGLTGYVADSSGALIPGVTVTVTNVDTGIAITALTNASGLYSFAGLPPGNYRLSAMLTGFQTATLTDINLGSAETQRVNVALKIGNSAGTSASVSAETRLAESAASVGQVVSEQQVRNLPMVGNNVLDLTSVLGGAATLDGAGVSNQGLQGQQVQQGQGQQGAAGGGGRGAGGGGRGGAAAAAGRANGVTGGTVGGVVGGAAGAPPPTPPPPASVRGIPDNPTIFGGGDNLGRPRSPGTASYAAIQDNPFLRVSQEPLSTFSSDVDTASYANMRRFINQNQLPPRDAVRIEEMINYFTYDYGQPSGKDPIRAEMEIASAPWNPAHRLVRIGIKARDVDARRRPSSNLVFLIDVSGSMQPSERLPLIKSGLKMLVGNLTENDHVSIVVYAGASGVLLPSTSGNRKDVISAALDRLEAGGSTNGGDGIQLAYQLAVQNFIPGGVNRVILATDGDFNVGITNQSQLTQLIQDRAKSGVFLSVLGVGTDNLKDSTMKRLADNGNGNYAYLDSLNEAYKVLVQQMGGTLVAVAKDVKLQVEFNQAFVEAYRLIGYESRLLANADFNNDRKDAGDMGAGHTVTALYEIVPRGGAVPGPDVDPLKYQTPEPAPVRPPAGRNTSNETLTLKIRYKDPDGPEEAASKLLSLPLVDREAQFSKASVDFRFAASVAEFGMILRDSPYRGKASVAEVLDNAQSGKGPDRNGYRQEFIGLVQRARSIRGLN